ncbi:CD48 antigen-like isoform X2 [Puntigrus tetrazona]|uniref:CD48 antigen-like isoform X2 n=1 Tax=Puntigrus tetrazona TaxID=1606681 RepID=UPI001C8AF7B0|nr:CD48 antigen-like isoform X2 [Puntigrus tetrazona]
MALNRRFRFLLYLLTFKTGLSAEISVFVRMGSSVEMDIQIQELPEFDDLSWRKDKSEMIVRYTNETKRIKLYSSYKDRVDFNDKTFSLTLKNMQETDSGLYTARASGETENDIVTYRVSVIDAVEAPVLIVNSNASSSDSCSVNFTCSAQEFMINSTYQNNRCSPEEVTSQINTLILDCSEESITCNHSNPVSWKEVRMSIKELCINNENESSPDQSGSSFLWPVVGSVAVFVLIICLLAFLYIKCKKGPQEVVEGTVYAQVEMKNTCSKWTVL